ncbi:MAG: DUF3817 domain-containing protein [Janthinobacterium lividum]
MRNALTRYRVMAYVVGVLLIVLVCVGLPLKYIGHDDSVVNVVGVAHGWLYMVLIITAIDLGRRARWSIWAVLGIAVSGLIPFVTFVAEHRATKDIKAKLAWNEAHPTDPEAVIADPQA